MPIRKNIFAAVLLLMAMAFYAAPAMAADDWSVPTKTPDGKFGGGKGTEDDPYLITNAQQLADLAYLVSYSYWNHKDFNGVYFKQTADIVLNDQVLTDGLVDNNGKIIVNDSNNKHLSSLKAWNPIGLCGFFEGANSNYEFKGHYDGGGHSISGVYFKGVDSKRDNYVGFFDTTMGAEIKNLTLKDCLYDVYYISTTGVRRVGALVGNATDTRIENCHVENAAICYTGNGDNQPDYKQNDVGGLVGYLSLTSDYGFDDSKPVADNCSFNGHIFVYSTNSETKSKLGGIFGRIEADEDYMNAKKNPVVKGCTTHGSICCMGDDDLENKANMVFAGGILGRFTRPESADNNCYAEIEGCANFMNMDLMPVASQVYAGGLSGYLTRCEKSANFGNITVSKTGGQSSDIYVGGIGTCTSVDNCANYGDIEVGNVTLTDNAKLYAAGLAVCGLGSGASESNACSVVNSLCHSKVDCQVSGSNVFVDALCNYPDKTASDEKNTVFYLSEDNKSTTYPKAQVWEESKFKNDEGIKELNTIASTIYGSNVWGSYTSNRDSYFYRDAIPFASGGVRIVYLDEKGSDNESVIQGETDSVYVTLTRTLHANEWNTVCLPFDVDGATLKKCFGEDVKLEILDNVTYDAQDHKVTFDFKAADHIEKGTPYMIKPTVVATSGVYDFEGCKLSASKVAESKSVTIDGTPSVVSMIGEMDKFTLKSDVTANKYFLMDGKFWRATAEKPISSAAFRCWFKATDVTEAKAMSISSAAVHHADGETTAVKVVETSPSATEMRIYDLQGIRHDKLQRGVNVIGGKRIKVIMK